MPDSSLFRRLYGSETWKRVVSLTGVNSLAALLAMASSIVLARTLGVQEYGLYVYAVSTFSFLSTIAALGIPTLVTRQSAIWAQSSQWGLLRGVIKFGLSAATMSSLLLGLAFLACRPLLGRITSAAGFTWAAIIVVPLLLFRALDEVVGGAFQGLHYIVRSTAPRTLLVPVCVLAYVGCSLRLHAPLTSVRVLVVQCVAALLVLVYQLYGLRARIPVAARIYKPIVEFQKWIVDALPFFGNGLFFVINTQVDILLLGYFRGDQSSAIYQVGTRGAQILILSLSAIATTVQPRMAELSAAGDESGLRRIITQTTRVGFIVALIGALLLVAFGTPVIRLLYGSPFISAATVLSILVVCRLPNAGTGSLGPFLTMTGREMLLFKALGLEAVANIVLNIILIPRWGMNGAAFSTGFSMATMNVALAVYTYKRYGVDVSILGKRKRSV